MQKILIIGGGIGGLTAAIALHQKGIRAEVFEAASKLEMAGKGIWVPPNAMQIFSRLGLDESIARRGVALDRVEIWDKDQGLLQRLDLSEAKEKFGHSITSLHRAELQKTLVEQIDSGTLHLGKRCTGFSERNDGTVSAEFDDGSHREGDLLIGADGIRSVIRRQLFPDLKLRYSGQTCYRGIAALRPENPGARICREIWGGRHRFGFSSIGTDEVYWFAPITALAHSPAFPAPRKELAGRYADFPDPVPEIISRTPAGEIIRTDLYDIAPLRSWSKGRVVLIGDAAHGMTPNLGQGGAQSVEDGYVLADALAKHQTEPRQAFRQYEQLRVAKAVRLVRTARLAGRAAHLENRWLKRVRNRILLHTPERINQRQTDEMYALRY